MPDSLPSLAAALGQMTLDFFDLGPERVIAPVPPAKTATPALSQVPEPRPKPEYPPPVMTPKEGATQAGFTPKIPKNTKENPQANAWLQAMSTSLHLHPQGTHRIVLQGQHLAYKLVRSPRRSVGFMIGSLGLEVRAAPRVSVADIEQLLHERSDWILRHLEKSHALEAQKPQQIWADGASCALHGQSLILRLRPDFPQHSAPLQDGVLSLPLPRHASAAQIERAALDWYGRYAHAHFAQRLGHYAPIMGVRWTQLKLSNANTRWGSAKRDGSIRLHWRLVQLAPELLDYVVVHELAHLHEMNHSPRFWAIVAQHCPAYKNLRAQLKHHSL